MIKNCKEGNFPFHIKEREIHTLLKLQNKTTCLTQPSLQCTVDSNPVISILSKRVERTPLVRQP